MSNNKLSYKLDPYEEETLEAVEKALDEGDPCDHKEYRVYPLDAVRRRPWPEPPEREQKAENSVEFTEIMMHRSIG